MVTLRFLHRILYLFGWKTPFDWLHKAFWIWFAYICMKLYVAQSHSRIGAYAFVVSLSDYGSLLYVVTIKGKFLLLHDGQWKENVTNIVVKANGTVSIFVLQCSIQYTHLNYTKYYEWYIQCDYKCDIFHIKHVIKKSACSRAAWCAGQNAGKAHQNKLHWAIYTYILYVCVFCWDFFVVMLWHQKLIYVRKPKKKTVIHITQTERRKQT